MGTYLNSITPYTLYKSECLSAYFVDKTLMLRELLPDEAIAQIKDKKYALRFAPKIAGNREYTGRILAVGIFVV